MANLKDEMVSFLRQDPVVSLINFELRGNPIRSDMYLAIADRIASGVIKLQMKTVKGRGGSYLHNQITLPVGFKLNNYANKSIVIHECTHAIIDYHGIGRHDFAEEEACAYTAAGVYWMYYNQFTLNFKYQTKIAASITIDGVYRVDNQDASSLMTEIRQSDSYKGYSEYDSRQNW
ncbi:hypothetical protein DYBT9623_04999 [Dyadobacter sp. CECT 9623]|uniref:Uncharacterized protein n=1 Tax=Dyadobacter linearis TaxID=2823330 RepID=A0ABM8UXH3_9BACT|nr:hypothetical protein [Dyadobacter sp. CECT 9623]CAG5074237.1 hypothetical protein DYBT9623_04999 [Dyadobacter sp. CECT 9623]